MKKFLELLTILERPPLTIIPLVVVTYSYHLDLLKLQGILKGWVAFVRKNDVGRCGSHKKEQGTKKLGYQDE